MVWGRGLLRRRQAAPARLKIALAKRNLDFVFVLFFEVINWLKKKILARYLTIIWIVFCYLMQLL